MTSVWTQELKQVVFDKWGKFSASQIAGELNSQGFPFSRNAVIGVAHRAGLISGIKRRQKPKISPELFVCQDARDIEPLHIGLMDLTNKTCKWPLGEGPFTFCGHEVAAGPYCFGHYRLSTGEGTPSEQAAHKIGRDIE